MNLHDLACESKQSNIAVAFNITFTAQQHPMFTSIEVNNCTVYHLIAHFYLLETYYCYLDDNYVYLSLSLKWYKRPAVVPLIYTEFIGEGTVDNPDGKQIFYVESPLPGSDPVCSANLSNPDTSTSNDTHTIRIPAVLTTPGPAECGTYYVSTHGSGH